MTDPTARPRWSTRRTPSRPTHGPRIGEAMARMGWPPMPWQQELADIAGEFDENGELFFDVVLATVPRQSGKSTLETGVMVDRATDEVWGGPQVSTLTAQTGKDGVQKLVDDWWPIIDKSPYGAVAHLRRSHGSEAILWDNGSRHEVLPPTPDGGHGKTIDVAFLDEVWAYPDHRVEQGVVPAMVTRRNSQLWIVSTRGDETSVYLDDKIAQGRTAAELDLREGICYVEYSAPEDADPADPATWQACMPALGHTQSPRKVKSLQASMDPGEFSRAFLNIPKSRRRASLAVSAELWSGSEGAERITGQEAWAVSTGHERSSACVARAGFRDDGVIQLLVMEYGAGVGWVAGRIGERKPGVTIALDKMLTGFMVPDLERAGLDVRELGTADAINAFAKIGEYLADGKAKHARNAALDDAAANATTRGVRNGDGALFKRIGAVDISPLVACSLALWALLTAPPEKPKVVTFG